MKSCSVFLIEQKMVFEKVNCFFVDFLRSSFGRIKVMSTVVEREYLPDITQHICFAYQLTGFYMIRGFTERYFLQLLFRKPLLFRKCTQLLFQAFFIENLLYKQLRKSIVILLSIDFANDCFARSLFTERKNRFRS